MQEIPTPKTDVQKPKDYPQDSRTEFIKKERENLVREWNDQKNSNQRTNLLEQVAQGTLEKPDAQFVLAREDFLAGDNILALQRLQHALESDPNHLQSYHLQSIIYRFMAKNQESLAAANQLIHHAQTLGQTAEPNDRPLYGNLLASGHFQKGRTNRVSLQYQQAIEEYEKALEVLPKFIPALEDMENLYRTCPDRSIKNVEKADEYKNRLDIAIAERDAAEKEAEAAEKKR